MRRKSMFCPENRRDPVCYRPTGDGLRLVRWSSPFPSIRLNKKPASASVRDGTGIQGGRVRNYDLKFLKRFSMIIAFLVALTILLILLARHLQQTIPAAVSTQAMQRIEARIAPVGAVYAGATGAAQQAAAAKAAAAAAASQVAYGGTLDGSVIYNNLCTGCHTSGVSNAPTLEKAKWTARISQGKDTLYKHAIEGFTGSGGMMPPKGGNPALSDEQVHAAVDWMLDNLK